MKEDILIPKVEGVITSAVPMEGNEEGHWEVYLVNQNDFDLEGVLVNSKGYGSVGGEEKATSVLRHFLDVVPANSAKLIEPMTAEMRGLTNEFWLSYFAGGKMYDKKYVYLPETICKENLSDTPVLGKRGVLHK